MNSLGYLLLLLSVFSILKVVGSLHIQFDDIVGDVGSNDTTLTCAFTKDAGETVQLVVISVRNVSTGVFSQIAYFLPDKYGVLVTGVANFSGRVILSYFTQLSTNVTLTFKDLQCDVETSFRCKIQTFSSITGSTEKEETMNLTVAVNPSVPNIVWGEFSVFEGDDVTFSCIGNIGKPPGIFVWQKREENAVSVSYRNVSTELTIVDLCYYNGTSNLTIQVTDYDNNAVIRCSVNNSNDEVYYDETRALDVIYKVRKPSITRRPMYDEYLQGTGQIKLTCTGRGNPKPSYVWFKDGNMNETLNSTKTLYITDVVTNNSGVYRCNASNNISGIGYTESTTVNITIVMERTTAPTTTTRTTGKESTKDANKEKEKDTTYVIGVVVGAVAVVIVVVIIGCIIYQRKRLKLENNYDNLRLRESPGQGTIDAAYDGIIINSTTDVSQYENSESTTHTDTARTTGLRANYENHRTGDEYEYAYVNPANEHS